MYKLVAESHNEKTGTMPAVYGEVDSCPPTCGLFKECYGKQGRAALHWATPEKKNVHDFEGLLHWITNLPRGMWRFGVVGDFPGDGVTLNRDAITKMARANERRQVLAYSHYPITPENLDTLNAAKAAGMPINASCDSVQDIKTAIAARVPVVTYTAADDTRKSWVDDGIKYVTCPYQTLPSTPKCKDCKLCSKGDRDYVIVFRAHATKKKQIIGVV